MPCGWSREGLETFNVFANEVILDRSEHGKAFDNDFKENIKQELTTKYKTKKRKRSCIDTYSDLMDEELLVKNEDEENWVSRKGFAV